MKNIKELASTAMRLSGGANDFRMEGIQQGLAQPLYPAAGILSLHPVCDVVIRRNKQRPHAAWGCEKHR